MTIKDNSAIRSNDVALELYLIDIVVVTVFIGRFEIHTMVYDKVCVYK